VAVTTAIYRKAIDMIKAGETQLFKDKLPELLNELEKVSHRPYTIGFLATDKELQHYKTSSYIRNYKFLGIYRNGVWEIRNRIGKGIEVELFFKNGTSKSTKIKNIYKNGEPLNEAHPNSKVKIDFENEYTSDVPELSILREKILI